ncbi:MAG TPA: ATP-binding protein [Candidatus Acidoferrales bacterium]|nr:ATP-binding protein [Candidatus Acidoferrales bacterium]
MTFRSRLFWLFTFFVVLAVGVVAFGVTLTTRHAFEQLDTRHSDALVAQFQREFQRRGQEAALQVRGIADAEATIRMAIELSRPNADVSIYVNDAHGVAASHQLDFLDFVNNDGSIISSAEWPTRFGYKMTWLTEPEDWATRGAFLTRVDTEAGPVLGLLSVATLRVGDKNLYVIGGDKLGQEFMATLALPEGMRAVLYRNLDPSFSPADLIDATGPFEQADRLAPLVEKERSNPVEQTMRINWSADPASAESFHLLPLKGRSGELLGILLIGSSQRDRVLVEGRILLLAIGVAALGVLLGALLSWWGATRVTEPVRKLVEGANQIAAGNLDTHVPVTSKDEIGQLARAFNVMSEQLIEQRERVVQAERVAAWRELARRLAHELKNPLFPIQITVENLRRAREQTPDQFDEVFRESTSTLLFEIENLKAIIARFSEFAQMPQPVLVPVNLNDLIRSVIRVFEAQFNSLGRPPITSELLLDDTLPMVHADPVLLQRAIENLILNAMDAMPGGGTLRISTSHGAGLARLEIVDTGVGLTLEECQRLFTPYYTTKQHGTGLGLAIVQSVISDQGGTITVESEAGVGTTFRIDLHVEPSAPRSEAISAAPLSNVLKLSDSHARAAAENSSPSAPTSVHEA